MKVWIVCFKEYAHGPKVLERTKVFLDKDKDKADKFAEELTDKWRHFDADPANYWCALEKEVEE